MKKPSLRRFWWKSYRPVAYWSTITCQSPLSEVTGRWSMLTRRVVFACTGSWEYAAAAEKRSAARRRRVEACGIEGISGTARQVSLQTNIKKGFRDIILRPLNKRLLEGGGRQHQM